MLELTGRSRTQSRPSRLVAQQARRGAPEVALQTKASLGRPPWAHAGAAQCLTER